MPAEGVTGRYHAGAVNAALQAEYGRLTGMSRAALTATIEPYLPVVCASALLAGAWPAQRQQLIQRVDLALCSDD